MRDFHQPGRSASFAQNGMCATSHPLAAQTAIDILKRGGNAMDAAIAGAVLLGSLRVDAKGILGKRGQTPKAGTALLVLRTFGV